MASDQPIKGGWVILRYPARTKICDQVLPARMAASRRKDIEARYSEPPLEIHRRASVHWETGGCLFLEFTKRHINFSLSGGRTLHIWADYLEDLRHAVRSATTHELGGKVWRRMAAWPGRQFYLSPADVKKLLFKSPTITEGPVPAHEVVP